jgi:hypothetical protein
MSPFLLKGVERSLPPGEYEAITDEELIEGLSFPVYRRVSTMIFVPGQNASAIEMVAIDPQELQRARPKPWRLVFQMTAASMMQRGGPCGFGDMTAQWRYRFS